MELEKIKAEMASVAKAIDEKLVKANEQARTAADEASSKVEKALKDEIASHMKKYNDLVAIQQEQLDNISTQLKKASLSTSENKATFSSHLEKGLEKFKDQLSLKRQGKSNIDFTIDFDLKAVGDMATATHIAAGVIEEYRRPGIIQAPFRDAHIREFITTYPTNSPLIKYVQENGGEGSPGMTAEGALKPQIDYDLKIMSTEVKKIAAHLRLPEEMIEDIPYITAYVTNRGSEDLRLVEDAQILYGDGTGNNLRGLTLDAATFAAGATFIISNPQRLDVIRAAMKQIRIGRYKASAVMVHPTDYALMELTKDTTGNYLLVNVIQNGLTTIWRLPVIESDAITEGSFFMGDFRNGAELFDRKALNVRFYDQDRDNAIRNMVTIVIEERLALANIRPASFVKGTFAAAITDLTS